MSMYRDFKMDLSAFGSGGHPVPGIEAFMDELALATLVVCFGGLLCRAPAIYMTVTPEMLEDLGTLRVWLEVKPMGQGLLDEFGDDALDVADELGLVLS